MLSSNSSKSIDTSKQSRRTRDNEDFVNIDSCRSRRSSALGLGAGGQAGEFARAGRDRHVGEVDSGTSQGSGRLLGCMLPVGRSADGPNLWGTMTLASIAPIDRDA